MHHLRPRHSPAWQSFAHRRMVAGHRLHLGPSENTRGKCHDQLDQLPLPEICMKLPGAQRNGIHKMKKHPNDPTVTEKIPQKFEGMRLPLGCRCRPGDVWSNVVHVSQNLVQEDPPFGIQRPCQPSPRSCHRLVLALVGSHHLMTCGSTKMWPQRLKLVISFTVGKAGTPNEN